MSDAALVTTPFHSHATASEVIAGVDLSGRRAVVTGGASGIGLETTRTLAAAGAEVTVAVRDPDAAYAALGDLVSSSSSSGTDRIHVRALDLADLASVKTFAEGWQGPLDILVANAGVMAIPTRQLTNQGWEMQLAVNYLGHFALAHSLHDSLRASGAARLVIVSSGAHRSAAFDFEDPQFEQRPYDRWTAYGQSKTADVLLAVGARRWADDGIAANAVNPGWIMTNLQRHVDAATMRAMGAIDENGEIIPQPYSKTPEQGAATSVLLAASPLVNDVTGRYFEDNQEAPVVGDDDERPGGVAVHAMDALAADRLWDYGSAAIRD
ncbi:SDR family NAD(P)-dependent oxidoreductase [Streptomyces zhihengii]|uniref:SDR family NAD(P)-dependent oxidoreductase n=1 Tax=Streptomyces zhihengii TaxID=1818004 RepID=UPI0033B401E6